MIRIMEDINEDNKMSLFSILGKIDLLLNLQFLYLSLKNYQKNLSIICNL